MIVVAKAGQIAVFQLLNHYAGLNEVPPELMPGVKAYLDQDNEYRYCPVVQVELEGMTIYGDGPEPTPYGEVPEFYGIYLRLEGGTDSCCCHLIGTFNTYSGAKEHASRLTKAGGPDMPLVDAPAGEISYPGKE